MLKKICTLTLALALLLSTAAMAETTNRDMQMYGGVLVLNDTASFFFAPMEEGVTRHWGLYSTESMTDAPIVEITEGIPARLVYADNEKVYFFGYDNPQTRTTMTLYSIEIATGANETLLEDVAGAFVGQEAGTFLYVTASDAYTLHSYNIPDQDASVVKDMSGSKRTIVDAMEYKGIVYFIGKNESGDETTFQYHASSGKATNIDAPSPTPLVSMLYEGYRVYSTQQNGERVYSAELGIKKAVSLASKHTINLFSPRFGQAMYAYDGENHRLIYAPLDGAAEKTLDLEGSVMTRLVLGGTKDELLLLCNGAIYAITPNLSGQEKVIDFSTSTGGQIWSHVVPVGDDKIAVFGYNTETFTHMGNLLPTGVYILDRASGDILFGYPDAGTAFIDPASLGAIGDVPLEGLPEEDGETHFF